MMLMTNKYQIIEIMLIIEKIGDDIGETNE